MLLVIGLGNPGEKYKKTRHNAGFLTMNIWQKSWNFPSFKFNKKFIAELSEKDDVMLIKPQTFMNRSGESIKKIIDFYKLSPENILIVHDELDIEIGNYKISKNSRSAGHNGVQSVINNLGTKDFYRLRLGIEKEGGRKERGLIPGEKFALQNFTITEYSQIKKAIKKASLDLADRNFFTN